MLLTKAGDFFLFLDVPHHGWQALLLSPTIHWVWDSLWMDQHTHVLEIRAILQSFAAMSLHVGSLFCWRTVRQFDSLGLFTLTKLFKTANAHGARQGYSCDPQLLFSPFIFQAGCFHRLVVSTKTYCHGKKIASTDVFMDSEGIESFSKSFGCHNRKASRSSFCINGLGSCIQQSPNSRPSKHKRKNLFSVCMCYLKILLILATLFSTNLQFSHFPSCLCFNSQQKLDFMWSDKSNSLASPASSSRPSNTVNVSLRKAWDGMVDHQFHLQQRTNINIEIKRQSIQTQTEKILHVLSIFSYLQQGSTFLCERGSVQECDNKNQSWTHQYQSIPFLATDLNPYLIGSESRSLYNGIFLTLTNYKKNLCLYPGRQYPEFSVVL